MPPRQIDFGSLPYCAGPCDKKKRETMNISGKWFFNKPHNGHPIPLLRTNSKEGIEIELKNFRLCEICFRTFLANGFAVGELEKKRQINELLEDMYNMGYAVAEETKK